MKPGSLRTNLRCAVYTRVSTEHGLEQKFNSLDNQREASEAYIKSQGHEGWRLMRDRYDDGGFSGGSMERPALEKLLDAVRARRIDVIVVYKVDRLPDHSPTSQSWSSSSMSTGCPSSRSPRRSTPRPAWAA
jgi:DNA invertase Pin-like site-specific DNA recombinase